MTGFPDEFPLPQEAFDRQRALVSAQVDSPGRPSPIRRRRVLVPALAVVVLVIAGAATAGGVHWWSGPSSVSSIDTTKATSLVEYTLSSDFSIWKKGDTLALWRMQQPDGSVCVFAALSSPRPTAPGRNGQNPFTNGFCSQSGSMLYKDRPISSSLNSGRAPGGDTWLVYGEVRPGSGIAWVELRSATGSTPLAYSDGWYLGQPPPGTSSSEFAPGGNYLVVGYDENGEVAGQFDLVKTFGGFVSH